MLKWTLHCYYCRTYLVAAAGWPSDDVQEHCPQAQACDAHAQPQQLLQQPQPHPLEVVQEVLLQHHPLLLQLLLLLGAQGQGALLGVAGCLRELLDWGVQHLEGPGVEGRGAWQLDLHL